MSLDQPKICEECGENIRTYGHRIGCRTGRLALLGPCSECGEPDDHIHYPGLRDLWEQVGWGS